MSDQAQDGQDPNINSESANQNNNQNVDTTNTQSDAKFSEAQVAQMIRDVAQGKQRELDSIRQQLDEIKQSQKPPEKTSTYEEFIANPEAVIKKVLQSELDRAVSPIRAEVDNFKADREFKSAVGELVAGVPSLQPFLSNQEFLNNLNQVAARSKQPITSELLYGLTNALVGQIAVSGKLDSYMKPANNNGGERSSPNIPSQAPPAPKGNQESKPSKLTDEEKAAAKMLNMTDDQYFGYVYGDGTIDSLRAAHNAGAKK